MLWVNEPYNPNGGISFDTSINENHERESRVGAETGVLDTKHVQRGRAGGTTTMHMKIHGSPSNMLPLHIHMWKPQCARQSLAIGTEASMQPCAELWACTAAFHKPLGGPAKRRCGSGNCLLTRTKETPASPLWVDRKDLSTLGNCLSL